MLEDTSENNYNSPEAAEQINAAPSEESFASMLEKSGDTSSRLSPGQRIKARVVSISGDLVYIYLGGKSEGVIDLEEFKDENGVPNVHEGDEVEAFFVSVQDGVRKLTTLVRGYSAVTLNAIKSAFEAGVAVNGEVKREVKGGFEISVGGVRCFCPFSQIDLKGGREGGVYLGRSFAFKVLEYEAEGKNIIVSRRSLLDEEKQAKIAKLKEDLVVGNDVTARISSVQNFGAFVDLGGIEGLIPASEISWTRIDKPADVLSPGQEVTARILSLDWEHTRLTLSIKATLSNPWESVAGKYPIDSRVNGTIVRLVPFGAFVTLEPGIDGLVHISNLGAGRRINHPKEVVEVGQQVEVYVLSVDPQNKKIALSMQPKVEPQKVVLPSVGETIDGIVEKVMPFGIFVKMPCGINGLVPNSEIGTPQGTDLRRMFPSGTEMQVAVVEVDTANNKVRLSRKALMEKEVQEEYNEYMDSVKKAENSSGGFGSLGEILKAKMDEKNQAV
jgi:small subunit ribosomal protein S1